MLIVPRPISSPKNFWPNSSGLNSVMRRWSATICQTRAGGATMWIDASRGGTRSAMGVDLPVGQLGKVAVTGVERLDQDVGDPRVVEQREVVGAGDVLGTGPLHDRSVAGDPGCRG